MNRTISTLRLSAFTTKTGRIESFQNNCGELRLLYDIKSRTKLAEVTTEEAWMSNFRNKMEGFGVMKRIYDVAYRIMNRTGKPTVMHFNKLSSFARDHNDKVHVSRRQRLYPTQREVWSQYNEEQQSFLCLACIISVKQKSMQTDCFWIDKLIIIRLPPTTSNFHILFIIHYF